MMTMIRPHIQKLAAYASGAQPPEKSGAIRLNLNENPYPPSPQVKHALQTFDPERLRRYPDAQCDELRAALAKHYGVDKNQTCCGNGSSEIISLLFSTFLEPGCRIAIPDPSFALYSSIASFHQVECIQVPTRDDFSVDVDRLLQSDAQAIVLVNPNAPTGRILAQAEVERLVSCCAGLVIIDEAYMDFSEAGVSAIPLIERYSNLVIVRTFSKAYSLCGARVGYCFSHEAWIAALNKGKNLYNINGFSQKLALAALQDQEYVKSRIHAVRRTRDTFSAEIRRLGFEVISSQTNFILCSPPPEWDMRAQQLYEKLMEKNIYVRYFRSHRLLDKLRISIGTDEEMAMLYDELRRLFEAERIN